MCRWACILAAVIISQLLVGCVSDQAFRNGAPGEASAPVQEVAYDAADGRISYVLSHVEFDDQGWFHDRRQRDVLFDKLIRIHEEKRQMLLVVYTHGWKHNAQQGDENLADFHKLLAELSRNERTRNAGGNRVVVGIYVGWRGNTIPIPVIEHTTFWTRKNAAERVGSRSVKQLFMELNQFRGMVNRWSYPDELAGPKETQLIFVGHSFGGLITYHALHTQIIERSLQVTANGEYRTAKSFGDFVMLVNPAFEGAAYQSIWQAVHTRKCFPSAQKPVMAIVTSEADLATKLAFPVGRLYTLLQSAEQPGEREAVMHTIGHLAKYRTHTLSVIPPGITNVPSTQIISGLNFAEVENDMPPGNPYYVIATDGELIKGHNDFWNARFRDFVFEFVKRRIMEGKTEKKMENETNKKQVACKAFEKISSVGADAELTQSAELN